MVGKLRHGNGMQKIVLQILAFWIAWDQIPPTAPQFYHFQVLKRPSCCRCGNLAPVARLYPSEINNLSAMRFLLFTQKELSAADSAAGPQAKRRRVAE